MIFHRPALPQATATVQATAGIAAGAVPAATVK